MARRFKTVDYEKSGQQTITIDDVLPEDHLGRFIVSIVAMLDLSAIYGQCGAVGGEAYAPEVLKHSRLARSFDKPTPSC